MHLALAVLLQVTPPAFGTARPAECAKADGTSGTNVWDRARAPELRIYCEKLAAATSLLVGTGPVSSEVLTLVDEAARARPERASPHVLRGRALARLGRHAEALAAFEQAKMRDERAIEEPRALATYAHGLARAGRHADAVRAYRALLPRASQLDVHERGQAYLSAGLLLLAEGTASTDDALAVLRQARREAQESLQVLAALALGLALDRAGEAEQARSLVAERFGRDPRRHEAAFADARAREVLAVLPDPAEEHALRAMLFAEADAPRASALFRDYAEKSTKKTWEAHARKRADALGAARKPAPKKGP